MVTSCAINFELSSAPVPDWVQLLPPGPTVAGIDGRSWLLDSESDSAIIADFQRRNRPLAIDWEHATEIRAPEGLPAPAAGWIDTLDRRADGSWWARVGWTESAAQQIAAREYRFISPVFTYEKTSSRITAIVGAGLTNTPNLPLTSLNREDSPMSTQTTVPTAVLTALGLAAAAEESVVVAAIDALKAEKERALNRAETPDLARFVPRQDYDAAMARATNAEQVLRQKEQQEKALEIDALIQAALVDGKITPATENFYRTACNTEEGKAEFKKFLSVAAPIVTAADGKSDKPTVTHSSADPKDTDGFKVYCKAQWDADESIRRDFGNSFGAFHAFQRANAEGRVKLFTRTM